jgi:hypothetical protein
VISSWKGAVVSMHLSADCRARKVEGVDMHVLFLDGSARVLYEGGPKSFRPDLQKSRQIQNAARDIQRHLW